MIDLSKIRVGDEVTVRGEVTVVHHDDPHPIRLHGGTWVKRKDIVAHHPKPREFKPGDPVYWFEKGAYKIVAIDGGQIWIKGRNGNLTAMVEDLRHADESE